MLQVINIAAKPIKYTNYAEKNKPKDLKVAKEDQRLIGSMVSRLRLDG